MANFYDMTPEELDLYIKEGGYDDNKAKFLRNEWANKNTLSGKAKSSLEDITQLPEGFDRANFLPVSKPEGKSVIDAIKSGEADWAMPGALVDTADKVLTSGRTGEKMTAGLPVTEDEQMQAAFTGAGVAAGGSGAFSVPDGATRIFGGQKAKGFKNKDTKAAEELIKSGADTEVVWEETGLHFNPSETRWEFEIDSKGMKVKPEVRSAAIAEAKTLAEGEVFGANLSDFVDFPELFQEYPALSKTKLEVIPSLGHGAKFAADTNTIEIGPGVLNDESYFREVVLHELQHGVQSIEGTTGGSSVNYLVQRDFDTGEYFSPDPKLQSLIDSRQEIVNRAKKAIADEYQVTVSELDDLNISKLSPDDIDELPDNVQDMVYRVFHFDMYLNREAFNAYQRNTGEVQARAAGSSDYLTSEEKRTTSPGERYKQQYGIMKDKSAGPYMPTYKLDTEGNNIGGWNKGGLITMDEQMSMFDVKGFSEGGMPRDPVSGNEIPPGSSAEEVRDDIDAKLSAGEYVVPADVVQFFGVKFFEDLRTQAKQQLAKMSEDGRVGGEPVMDDELSPEEVAMLQEVMSEGEPIQMAGGGMVSNALTMLGQKPKEEKTKLNEKPSFNPSQWRGIGSNLGGNSGGSGATSGSMYKTYVGPNGEIRMILFVNGEPTTPIPNGFKEQTSATQQTETPVEQVREKQDPDSNERDLAMEEERKSAKGWAEKNFDELSNDPIGFGMKALEGNMLDQYGGLALGAIAGPLVGGVAHSALQLENIAAATAARDIAKAKGLDTTPLDSALKEATGNLPTGSKLMQRVGFGTGKTYLDSFNELANSGKTPNAADKGQTNSAARVSSSRDTNRDSRDNREPSSPQNAQVDSNQRGNTGTVDGVQSRSRQEAIDSAVSSGSISKETASGLSNEQAKAGSDFDAEKGNWSADAMNKGGLIKKRPTQKKQVKTKKGLVTKK